MMSFATNADRFAVHGAPHLQKYSLQLYNLGLESYMGELACEETCNKPLSPIKP